eukprot:COSAG01_NODE_3279_length_6310_cov_7.179462_1_plen_187_part_00
MGRIAEIRGGGGILVPRTGAESRKRRKYITKEWRRQNTALRKAWAKRICKAAKNDYRRWFDTVAQELVAANFHTDATALYSRLQARGYPPRFLDLHFSTAPNWSSRQQLLLKNSALQQDTGSPSDRVHVLALPYSRVLETTQVAHAIHEHATLLPPHLTEGRHLVAWKAASRIGDSLTTYRLTNDD